MNSEHVVFQPRAFQRPSHLAPGREPFFICQSNGLFILASNKPDEPARLSEFASGCLGLFFLSDELSLISVDKKNDAIILTLCLRAV
jgi:hypothetical protein